MSKFKVGEVVKFSDDALRLIPDVADTAHRVVDRIEKDGMGYILYFTDGTGADESWMELVELVDKKINDNDAVFGIIQNIDTFLSTLSVQQERELREAFTLMTEPLIQKDYINDGIDAE
jgi:F420-dependent methylenetetrahydromethanopterin dehydrogenase